MARYLYGDSQPFPLDYDFLQTLEGFLDCAGKSGKLAHEIDTMEKELSAYAQGRTRLLDSLNKFCGAAADDLHKLVQGVDATALGPYANRVVESIQAMREEAQASITRETQDKRAQTERQIEERRRQIHGLIDKFFTHQPLSVLASTFSMLFSNDAMALNTTLTLPGKVSASFELDPTRTSHWRLPRRAHDFLPGINVQVGMKKKFLSKSLVPEVVDIGEFTVSSVELAPEKCEVHLRKRPDSAQDAVVFNMLRNGEGAVHASVQRFENGETGHMHEAESEDVPKLLSFWKALSDRSQEALVHRRRLRWLALDGKDVLEHGLLPQLFDHLVSEFTPIVKEISERSPSKAELALKIDRADGRREEIYKRKETLAALLQPLPDTMYERFAILDIFPE